MNCKPNLGCFYSKIEVHSGSTDRDFWIKTAKVGTQVAANPLRNRPIIRDRDTIYGKPFIVLGRNQIAVKIKWDKHRCMDTTLAAQK